MFTANVLKTVTKPFSVRHYCVDVVAYVVVNFVVAVGVIVVFVVFTVLRVLRANWGNYIFEGPLFMFLFFLQ